MKSEIIKQKDNPFFQREEIVMKVNSEITPTNEELKKEIGKDPELIVIQKIDGNFGKQEFTVEAQVYDSKEAREKYEIIPKKIRIQMEKEKKEAEVAEKKRLEEEKAAAEAAKAEAEAAKETPEEKLKEESVEEKVEETKEEEKSE